MVQININHNNFKQIKIEGMKTVFLMLAIWRETAKAIKPQPNYKIQK